MIYDNHLTDEEKEERKLRELKAELFSENAGVNASPSAEPDPAAAPKHMIIPANRMNAIRICVPSASFFLRQRTAAMVRAPTARSISPKYT